MAKARSKLLASASYDALRRAAGRKRPHGIFAESASLRAREHRKNPNTTPSISARQAETRRAQERYGMATPEIATEARKQGSLSYTSSSNGNASPKPRGRAPSPRQESGRTSRSGPDEFAGQATPRTKNRAPPRRRRPLSEFEEAKNGGRRIVNRRLGLDDGRRPIFRRPGRRFHARLAHFLQHGLCSMNDVFRHFAVDWDELGEFRDEAPEFTASPFFHFATRRGSPKRAASEALTRRFAAIAKRIGSEKEKRRRVQKLLKRRAPAARRSMQKSCATRKRGARKNAKIVRWYVGNPERVRDHKRRERDANYFRPFVAIDSEGQNYPGVGDIMNSEPSGSVLYEKHETYLWGAAADNGYEPEWLTASGTNGAEKKPLSIYEILDWLLSLPEKFGERCLSHSPSDMTRRRF